jgi:hypothetical protein
MQNKTKLWHTRDTSTRDEQAAREGRTAAAARRRSVQQSGRHAASGGRTREAINVSNAHLAICAGAAKSKPRAYLPARA